MEKHNLSHSKALEYLYQDLLAWLKFDPIAEKITEEFGENFIKIFDNEY